MSLWLPKRNYWLVAVLITVFLLRLPSFFEPYWYGDEGIYLVLGQAMQRGAVLYRDIWDNKPPLLYLIYALQPTLLWAKVSATVFVLATTYMTYKLAKKIFTSPRDFLPLLTATLTGTFLSLPILEGTIANAELYFTLPIIAGAYLLFSFLDFQRVPRRTLTLIGLLFTAAFLIKVPAVFDFLGMFLAYSVIRLAEESPSGWRGLLHFYLPILLVFLLILSLLTIYFLSQGALGDFLNASFSQNASYVAVGSGPFAKLTNPLFSKAAILFLGLFTLSGLYWRKKINRELLFLAFWFGFSLYGALLSNRPYLHYLLQIVPVGAILFFYLPSQIKAYHYLLATYFLVLLVLARMFFGGFALDSKAYYTNWWDYLSERKSWGEYVNFFDSRTTNSYAITKYLKQNSNPSDPIFVWGDTSSVYALANRPPATKFIQAHHLTTINPKNYDLVMARLQKFQPKFIIISRPVHFPFPALEAFVKKNYDLVNAFQDLLVYQNNIPANPPKFNVHY